MAQEIMCARTTSSGMGSRPGGEAASSAIFIGFACDYCAHVCAVAAESLRTTDAATADESSCAASAMALTLSRAGPSLFGAAVTTAAAAVPLLLCRVSLFRQMGEFILICTALSMSVALTLVVPLMHTNAAELAFWSPPLWPTPLRRFLCPCGANLADSKRVLKRAANRSVPPGWPPAAQGTTL